MRGSTRDSNEGYSSSSGYRCSGSSNMVHVKIAERARDVAPPMVSVIQ